MLKQWRHRLRISARELTGYDLHKYEPAREYSQFSQFADAECLLASRFHITAFDVGANTGQTIKTLLNVFPKITIHAFEPSPTTFDKLAPLAARNVKLNKCGLGASSGELELQENDISPLSSFLPLGRGGWGNITRKVSVPITTVDEYAANNGINRINFLKVDTQGFDLEVLKGADGMLSMGRIDLLLTEITVDALYVGMPSFDEIYRFMADRGYELTGFYDQKRRGRILGWFDAMFASPELARSSYEGAPAHF